MIFNINFYISYGLNILSYFLFQWLSLPVFVAYRLIVTAYNLAWLFYNIHLYGANMFIYVTNWTYTILNIYFVFATTLSSIALYKDLKKETETITLATDEQAVEIEMEPGNYGAVDQEHDDASQKDALQCHHKLFWFIYVIAATGGLIITAGYWSVLAGDDPVDANNITKHALNSVFMVIDTSLSAIPVRLLHFLYVMLYFLIYLVFTVIYWLLGGTGYQGNTYIYKRLDYENFRPINGGLVVVFLLLVLPFLHLILFSITKLRDHLYRKYNKA